MNKYKLIKEYPGSPKLGYILSHMVGTNMYFVNNLQIYPNEYPEFWKEEKELTIGGYPVSATQGCVSIGCQTFTEAEVDALLLLFNRIFTTKEVKIKKWDILVSESDLLRIKQLLEESKTTKLHFKVGDKFGIKNGCIEDVYFIDSIKDDSVIVSWKGTYPGNTDYSLAEVDSYFKKGDWIKLN